MMPRTGPKYAVRWYSDPGATPSLTPGDQSRPSVSSRRGATTQDSPGSSVERALSSLPDVGAMSGPIWVAASVGNPTCNELTASTSWLRNRFDLATEPTRISRDAAEHFCPACPN